MDTIKRPLNSSQEGVSCLLMDTVIAIHLRDFHATGVDYTHNSIFHTLNIQLLNFKEEEL